MNGREQADALARLAQPWKPDSLAGFRIGDLADCAGLGRVEIVELLPPSLLLVRTSTGATCRCGWRALRRVEARR